MLVIFSLIFTGIFCEKRKVFTLHQIEGFEVFLFKIALPSYFFMSTLKYDLSILINLPYIFSYLLSFFAIMVLVFFYFYKTDTLSKICMNIMAAGYTNVGIYALPVIIFLFNDPTAGILGIILQILLIQSVFITILSFINHKEKTIIKRLLIAITTPLIVMPALGLLCNYFQLIPPFILTTTMQSLGIGASGMSLFTFGLTFASLKVEKKDLNRELVFIVLLKNIFHPIVSLLIGKYIFGLVGYWLYSLVITGSAPTAFIVYFMAKQFSIKPDLYKKIVAITSAVSLVTLIFITLMLG